MLYHKLTETTIIFPPVLLFLGIVLLVEFSLSKSDGIDYISKVNDKCQNKLLIYMGEISQGVQSMNTAVWLGYEKLICFNVKTILTFLPKLSHIYSFWWYTGYHLWLNSTGNINVWWNTILLADDMDIHPFIHFQPS